MNIIKKHRKYNTEIRKKINSDLHKITNEDFMLQIYNLIIEDIKSSKWSSAYII